MPAPDFGGQLRAASLRVTRPRLAVLAALQDHPHADTDSIIRIVRADLGEVSHQAVYDVLRALTEGGLARRIQPLGSVARYELRVGNHHHVVCRLCGTIADVDCAVGETPCLTASDDHGFMIDEAEVIYWGRCPACPGRQTTIRPDRRGGDTPSERARQREREPCHRGPRARSRPGPGPTGTGGRTSRSCRSSPSTRR